MLKRFTKFLEENKALVLIVILATFLRFVYLTEAPPSLNWDEVSHGYNAYSILKTGKDEWGNFLPIIFRAYGDYKLPVYIYAAIPSIALFGLNVFAIRLPSVLAGIGTVIFTYFLAIELFRNKKSPANNYKLLASLSALLVAIEPWSFFLSRPALEANLALFLFVAGIYFFLRSLRAANYLLLSATFLGLTVWTYNSYRIFTPLMLVVLLTVYRKKLFRAYRRKKGLIAYGLPRSGKLCLLLIAIFFIPMFFQLLNPTGLARYGEVAIIDQGAINQINEQRNSSEFSPFVSRLFYNKGTYFTQKFFSNYLAHFSPSFLFFEGGSHYQFSVPGYGLIYPINAVLLLLGFVYLLKNRAKSSMLIVYWLLLSPVPSSLTREAPHVLRAITFLPIPMILAAVGLVTILNRLRKNQKLLTILIYIIIVSLFAGAYFRIYFHSYKANYSWSWQYGYRQSVNFIKDNYINYDKIIFTKKYGEPHEFILFFWPWNPESYRNDPNLNRFYQSNWYWVDAFDKFYFVNDWQIDDSSIQGNYTFELESEELIHCTPRMFDCILVSSPGNAPEGWKNLETINFLNGEPAFEIYEN